jgi:hypothetical protein
LQQEGQGVIELGAPLLAGGDEALCVLLCLHGRGDGLKTFAAGGQLNKKKIDKQSNFKKKIGQH